jgi:hypothetical protein
MDTLDYAHGKNLPGITLVETYFFISSYIDLCGCGSSPGFASG